MLNASKIYNELQNELFELDKDRRWYYNKVKPFKYLFWIPFLLGATFLLSQNFIEPIELPFYSYICSGIWMFISLIAYLAINQNNLRKFKEEFVKKIAPKIITGLGDSFSYQYDGKIPKREVRDSLLFKPFGEYSCQDLVMGVINDVPIKFAEIKMTIIRVRNNGKTRQQDIVFRGFFFTATLKSKFPTQIWLTTTSRADVSKSDMQKVKVDHAALKKYSVYAEDGSMAKKVLQPFVLERIEALNAKLKAEKVAYRRPSVSLYFMDQMVKMAIHTSSKFMEPKLSESINSQKFIEKQTSILNALSSLVDDLTLK